MKLDSKTILLAVALFWGVLAISGENEAPKKEFNAPKAVAALDQCSDIISYCYDMWWITRHNYEQYVGCVISNAENAGIVCQP